MVRMPEHLTLQSYLDGAWIDAARVEIFEPHRGIRSPSSIDYFTDYYFFDCKTVAAGLRARFDPRGILNPGRMAPARAA